MFDTEQEVEDTAVDSTTDEGEVNNTNHETDSDSESEAEATVEGEQQRKSETPEQKRARLKRQLAQLDKKHGFKEEDSREKGSSQEDSNESTEVKELKEKFNRLALAQNGYTDEKEQDQLIRYAKFSGQAIESVHKDPVALAIIKGLRDKAATPSSSTRTGKGGDSTIDSLVAKYKAGKYLPPDQMKLVRAALRG